MKIKKWLVSLLSVCCLASCAVSFSACDISGLLGSTNSNSSSIYKTPSVGLEYTVSYDKTYYIVTGVGTCADTEIVVSATYNNRPVTAINHSAFRDCDNLTSVEIPNSVTSIGDLAFYNCSKLTNVVIPDSVTNIGEEAFNNCSSLTSVEIPDSVTSIGYWAFARCSSLTSVVIPDSVTSIGENMFYNCSSLTSVVIPDSVTSIGANAFYECAKLRSVKIGNGVTNIDARAFYNCSNLTDIYITDLTAWCHISGLSSLMGYGSNNKKLYLNDELITELVIPDSVTVIGVGAFENCSSLTSVVIPDRVTDIVSSAFSNCSSLTNVVIPDSVTRIYANAFRSCTSLTSVVIPDGVTSIGWYAFAGCDNLTSVYYKGTAEEWANISIGSDNDELTGATIYYYIENEADLPTDGGNYWHYDENGEVVVWKKEE